MKAKTCKAPLRFSNRDLVMLIIPLVIEQLLNMTVGLADSMMVSYAGESAISGVSLVDPINNLIVFVFSALATGGAVVVSQYLGSGDRQNSRMAASQLVTFTATVSLAVTAVCLIGCRGMLSFLYGGVEEDVMQACMIYFVVSVISYPFVALYSACTAIFRSMGRARATMAVSMLMNLINVAGNALGVFVFRAGILGVALASLISRVVAALIMLVMAANPKNTLSIAWREICSWHGKTIRSILSIALPSGVQNGLFRISKLVLVRVIALFGTAQIAANGVAHWINSFCILIMSAMGLAVVTVVGQCVGANDYEQAEYYTLKLNWINWLSSAILNIAVIGLCPLILRLYSLSEEAAHIAYWLVVIHNIGVILIPQSVFQSALRAAGDARFTMMTTICSTVFCRVAVGLLLALGFNMGIYGVWIAMDLDWLVNTVLCYLRYRSGKWKQYRIV